MLDYHNNRRPRRWWNTPGPGSIHEGGPNMLTVRHEDSRPEESPSWDPIAEAAARPWVTILFDRLARIGGGGLCIVDDDITLIVVDPNLTGRAAAEVITHELIHDERRIFADTVGPDGMVLEEGTVRAITRRRMRAWCGRTAGLEHGRPLRIGPEARVAAMSGSDVGRYACAAVNAAVEAAGWDDNYNPVTTVPDPDATADGWLLAQIVGNAVSMWRTRNDPEECGPGDEVPVVAPRVLEALRAVEAVCLAVGKAPEMPGPKLKGVELAQARADVADDIVALTAMATTAATTPTWRTADGGRSWAQWSDLPDVVGTDDDLRSGYVVAAAALAVAPVVNVAESMMRSAKADRLVLGEQLAEARDGAR